MNENKKVEPTPTEGRSSGSAVKRIVRRFEKFRAFVHPDFKEKMIQYWMDDEGYETRDEALAVYGDDAFDKLCLRLVGETHTFVPDLGYADNEINGTLCFEEDDNNFVIPVAVLYA
jgi:hypothetical protein